MNRHEYAALCSLILQALLSRAFYMGGHDRHVYQKQTNKKDYSILIATSKCFYQSQEGWFLKHRYVVKGWQQKGFHLICIP